MTIEYFLDQNDWLEYQLYQASKSERIQKKKKRSRLRIPIFCIVFSFVFYVIHDEPYAISFFTIGVLWFFIYPIWLNRLFVNNYKASIKEKFTDETIKLTTIKFDEENLYPPFPDSD